MLLKTNCTLFECSVYNDLRMQYMDSYFYTNPNHIKIETIVSKFIWKPNNRLSVLYSKCFNFEKWILLLANVYYVCVKTITDV